MSIHGETMCLIRRADHLRRANHAHIACLAQRLVPLSLKLTELAASVLAAPALPDGVNAGDAVTTRLGSEVPRTSLIRRDTHTSFRHSRQFIVWFIPSSTRLFLTRALGIALLVGGATPRLAAKMRGRQ